MNQKHADRVLTGISFRLFIIAALFLVFVLPQSAFLPETFGAEILVGTVADELDGDPGNGECSLREAVANANNDDSAQSDCVAGDGADVIVLPAGEYTLAGASNEDDNLGGDLDITGELAISGEGASATFIQAGTSSPVGGGCVDCADRVLHVHVGATVVASDVSIRYGRAPDGDFDAAETFGGAIFNAGDLTLENCAVTCNRAGDGLEGDDGGSGGAIYNEGVLALIDVSVSDNKAGEADEGSMAGCGGGVYNASTGDATFSGCTVSGNEAFSGGGIYNAEAATAAMSNSTVSGNNADCHGGGLYSSSTATLNLNHVTVTNNTADNDNDSEGDGGGFYAVSSLAMAAAVVAGNHDKSAGYSDCYGEFVSQDYNLLGDSGGDSGVVGMDPCVFAAQAHDIAGTRESPVDPRVGSLGNYGGTTKTHYLEPESPAVGQIPQGVNGCDSRGTDQRGKLRLAPCDIGAYEGTFKTWTGDESDDWHTADNWSETGIPLSEQFLEIASGENGASCSRHDAEAGLVMVSDGELSLENYQLTIGEPPPDPKYELVLAIDKNGVVTEGSWADAYDRVVNQAQDCLLRFDTRLARPAHIEYTSTSMRFDFHPLEAWFDYWDAYAFVYMKNGDKAGLGSSIRRGNESVVWKKDQSQYPNQAWVGKTIYLYAEKNSDYTLKAKFYSNGYPADGHSWSELYDAVVNKTADCKIRVDSRIFYAEHIEYSDNQIYFDALGLNARYDESDNGWSAYAYASIKNQNRAGLGASYRRGHPENITLKDRSQHPEVSWNPFTVEVFCRDVYTEEYVMDSSGAMSSGLWDLLYHGVVDGACDCKVKYDNRISVPKVTTYGDGSLQFDFISLHAYFNNWDVYGLVLMEPGTRAGLAACYRRGYNEQVWKPSSTQYAIGEFTSKTVTVRTPGSFTFRKNLGMKSNGAPSYNTFSGFYRDLEDNSRAFDYKTRTGDRIMNVELLEYTGSNSVVNLDYHSLSGKYHNDPFGWEAFARAFLQDGASCGLAGSYRKGHTDYIHLNSLSQSTEIDTEPQNVDVFRR